MNNLLPVRPARQPETRFLPPPQPLSLDLARASLPAPPLSGPPYGPARPASSPVRPRVRPA